MPPKIAMDALPPPCLAMKNAMVLMGGEVSVESSRRCASGVVLSAFKAYRRQLQNWWPDTLYAQYSEMTDDGKRQSLVAYLRNPASAGFSSEALSDQPEDRGGDRGGPPAHQGGGDLLNPLSGGFPPDAPADLPRAPGEDDGSPPEKLRRVGDAGSAGADTLSSSAAPATSPGKPRLLMPRP